MCFNERINSTYGNDAMESAESAICSRCLSSRDIVKVLVWDCVVMWFCGYVVDGFEGCRYQKCQYLQSRRSQLLSARILRCGRGQQPFQTRSLSDDQMPA